MNGVGPLNRAPAELSTNSLIRFPRSCGPSAQVGPDSDTKAWSHLLDGKPLPPKRFPWIKTRFTGAAAGDQFQSANVLMLASVSLKPKLRPLKTFANRSTFGPFSTS